MACCWLSGVAQQRSAYVGLDVTAARQLVARVLPQRANAFVVEPLSREAGSREAGKQQAGKDVYEVEASGGFFFGVTMAWR